MPAHTGTSDSPRDLARAARWFPRARTAAPEPIGAARGPLRRPRAPAAPGRAIRSAGGDRREDGVNQDVAFARSEAAAAPAARMINGPRGGQEAPVGTEAYGPKGPGWAA